MKQDLIFFYIGFIALTVSNIFYVEPCKGQNLKYMNNWYFGNRLGITFANGNPHPLQGSSMLAQEGCATASDTAGNLLVYSNGETVWNNQHAPLVNGTGLYGGSSSSQGVLFVPKPKSQTEYYIFHGGDNTGALLYPALKYSIADITTNTVTLKNQKLLDTISEKVTAVMHCNDTNVWIIAHGLDSDAFYAFLLTSTGITDTVVSHSGAIHTLSNLGYASQGYMKASPNGKKLAIASTGKHLVEVFNFNSSTGDISLYTSIPLLDPTENYAPNPYGLEFSPDNNKLYVASLNDKIMQFDINSSTPNKGIEVADVSLNTSFAGIQRGPDGKIYIWNGELKSLDVIHKPNELGMSCEYEANNIGFFQFDQSYTMGLPNFWYQSLPIKKLELGKDTTSCNAPYLLDAGKGWDNYIWSTSEISSSILAESSNKYWVNTAYGCKTFSDTINVNIAFETPFTLGNDTTLCSGNTLLLNASYPGASFQWQDETSDPTYLVKSSGKYSVQLNKDNCYINDTVQVNYTPLPTVELGNDVVLCNDESLILDASFPEATYSWNDASTSATYEVNTPGVYWVIVSNACGTATDTLLVSDKTSEVCKCELDFPNIFTPNNDGINDVFQTKSCFSGAKIKVTIYNRWGESIFKSDNDFKFWDGKCGSTTCASGVYYWKAEFDQEAVGKTSGFVHLIREK